MPVPVSAPSMVVVMIMAAVPMMTAVPMTTPAAPVPSASRVTQLEPSEGVLSERLLRYLLRRGCSPAKSSPQRRDGAWRRRKGGRQENLSGSSAPTVGSRFASAALKRFLPLLFHLLPRSDANPFRPSEGDARGRRATRGERGGDVPARLRAFPHLGAARS